MLVFLKMWLKVTEMESLMGRDHFVDPGIGGRIILECILGKNGGKMWTGFIGSE
jgi:hypothetical protein